jgi:ATP-binding cassette subfamily B multidrug efflux pump
LKIEEGQTVALCRQNRQRKINFDKFDSASARCARRNGFLTTFRFAKFPLEQLRKSIGFVPQETFLFSDTLAENIAFGVEKIQI